MSGPPCRYLRMCMGTSMGMMRGMGASYMHELKCKLIFA